MPLKNYTTKVPAERTMAEVQRMLVAKGAVRFMTEYGDDMRIEHVAFTLPGVGDFKLPVRSEGVLRVFEDTPGVKADPAQAERTACRNVKDWIAAQIALVESEQATMAEVMLPYMLQGGQTLYEAMEPHLRLEGESDA